MKIPDVQIIGATETIFFGRHQGELRQWITLALQSSEAEPIDGDITITAGDQEVLTHLTLLPGSHEYRCFAPVLWPTFSPEPAAPIRLHAGAMDLASGRVSVGTHRPWIIYLLADVCTDATWVYDNLAAVKKDDADLTAAELALSEASRGGPPANHNHYNLVHSIELEYFKEIYPEQVERLAEALRREEITLNPFYNMTLTLNMSLEEQIRHFYPAREWVVQHGVKMAYANHQETPSIAWDMPGVLAGSGVRHLIKAILPYECPWVSRLSDPPLFIWEGIDGTQILLRRRNTDYVESNFVLKGLPETKKALHEKIIPEYEALAQRYPFNAISLLGCYGDLIPEVPGKLQSRDLPLRKASTIARYNDSGWEYPKLVNASHGQFWEDIETQITERGIQLEVARGDWGTGWDAWPACLAYDAAAWRRATERAGTADNLAAILAVLDPAWYASQKADLRLAWQNLRYLGDHAWNGANDANRLLNASLRREWQEKANLTFDGVITNGLQALSRCIPSGSSPRWMVYNSLGWERSGLVSISLPPGVSRGAEIIDVETGAPVATQLVEEDEKRLYFQASGVPSSGYRVFECQETSQVVDVPWKVGDYSLEGPFYTVEVSPVTGGIVSLYDNVRAKELVDQNSPYHLNQCLYLSDGEVESRRPYPLMHPPHIDYGTEYTPARASVRHGLSGPVFASLVVEAEMRNTRITSTITLYGGIDRVDIHNLVEKIPTAEKQELDFAFPFNIPSREYRCDTPAAILSPGKDHLPGAGLATAVIRHFVDIFNPEYGVTLSQADSFVIQFGHRTTTEDPQEIDPNNSTILVMAAGNIIDGNEAIRDQAGQEQFVFRFSLRGHAGGFDPAGAVRFGQDDNNELLCQPLPTNQAGTLPEDTLSFVSVQPESVILTCLKPAEEDGLIARVWECAGDSASAQFQFQGPLAPQAATKTNLIEQDEYSLKIENGRASVPVRPKGISAARFLY